MPLAGVNTTPGIEGEASSGVLTNHAKRVEEIQLGLHARLLIA